MSRSRREPDHVRDRDVPRGYALALEYARERPQGRLPSCKDPSAPQVKLVEHADAWF